MPVPCNADTSRGTVTGFAASCAVRFVVWPRVNGVDVEQDVDEKVKKESDAVQDEYVRDVSDMGV